MIIREKSEYKLRSGWSNELAFVEALKFLEVKPMKVLKHQLFKTSSGKVLYFRLGLAFNRLFLSQAPLAFECKSTKHDL